MQIILLEKIGGLGNLGDIVTVKNGYARNFLIPQGKAKRATEANKAEFEARRAELEARQAESLPMLWPQREIGRTSHHCGSKAGVDGRLFGSVTNADIASAIVATGIKAEKANVRLPEGPFKAIGEYEVEIALHSDAVAKVTVAVVAAAE